jgi:transposase InsO family protein
MAQHAQLRTDVGLGIYFCDPHNPWQRGTNESTNGLLRQYLPKGTDLSKHGADDLAAVAAALNSRPRKTLGWRTPAEALDHLLHSGQHGSVGTPLNLKPYTSWAFTRRATESGLVASIGGVGACYNNAMIESFWPAYRFCCSSGAAGGPASSSPTIFEYLEIFHNASADTAPWAMLSPVEFENRQPTTVA